MPMSDNLLERVKELEDENAYLKSLLSVAGIPFDIRGHDKSDVNDCFDPNQGDRIVPEEITENHARKFYSYFWGRLDVYSLRSEKKAYYPQCENYWKNGICHRRSGSKVKCRECAFRSWKKLDATVIVQHLLGIKVVGIYPLFPDGTCRFLVFDFDNHEKGAEADDFANKDQKWKEEVSALLQIGKENGIPMLAERSRSGRGAHVWIFFSKPVSAVLARKMGFALLDKGADSVNLTTFRFYDRMLPAQDFLDEGELGNLIALPLQGEALKQGNSAFVDEHWNAYPHQWEALSSIIRMSPLQVEEIVRAWSDSAEHEDGVKDTVKPWERKKQFHLEDVSDRMSITLSNLIYVKTANLTPRIQNQIRRLAAFSNPVFFKNRAISLSNFSTPRIIYLGEDDSGYICIPRGLLELLINRCDAAGIQYTVTDKRSLGVSLNIEFKGELRDNQKVAVDKMMSYDFGILSAATSFGKTVVSCNLIARRKVSTLILLESSSLIEQWQRTFDKYLLFDCDIPKYRTKTGIEKRRKSVIGIIQGSKDTSNGLVDIAMVGSLFKKGDLHPRLKEYGMVIVDECHHSASDIFTRILREVNARYVYGITATAFRADSLEKICEMYLGPVRFEYSARERAAEQGIDHFVIPRFTRTVYPHGKDNVHISDAYEVIRSDEIRNIKIMNDIKACITERRTPVVLTKFTDHAKILYDMLIKNADYVFLLTGSKSKKEQTEIRRQMENVPGESTMILVATGQLVGEGFDFPRLDTLIMADPVAWKGVVEQYAGRLNRDYQGKCEVRIYDYIDANIPVFDRMYSKRLKAYKHIGYSIKTETDSGKQNANAIFDFDSYGEVYEKDLLEAKKDIVISSPTLNRQKVTRLLSILRDRMDSDVKVTIVTWHPDSYKYGTDEHRIELMEKLRNCSVNIHLVKDNCEHYAVIDNCIVWYGSMNLLSKDDMDDNIMRVISRPIATELLEMTFGKGNHLTQYDLPLL